MKKIVSQCVVSTGPPPQNVVSAQKEDEIKNQKGEKGDGTPNRSMTKNEAEERKGKGGPE